MNHPLNPPPPVVGGEPDDQDSDAVAALLDQARLDAGLAVPVSRRSAAHRQVREALGRGWTSEQILAVLSQPLTGAAKPAAAFAWRVREQLADEPPRPPAQPSGKGGRWTVPWCGACDGDRTRQAYANRADATDTTLAGPCPTCGQDSMRLTSVA